jgi:ATP-dependent DNA helicase RecG
MANDLSSPVQYLKGVGPYRAKLLSKLGISIVRDLLFYLPYRYEDRSSIQKISSLKFNELYTVTGKVLKSEVVAPSPKRPRFKIFQLIITDGSGILKAKWFNQIYLQKKFSPGQEVILYGMVKPDYWGAGFEMLNPEYEVAEHDDSDDILQDSGHIHTGRIVPVYHLTEGLGQKQLRTIMYGAVNSFAVSIKDTLPDYIRLKFNMPGLSECLLSVHFPPQDFSLDELNGGTSLFHKRLSFDELFTLQTGLAVMKKGEGNLRGIAFTPDGRLGRSLIERLPFKLTAAQERVISEIYKDMAAPAPMSRLVQGDVGSGKTIVALLAMLAAVECGYQAALMAPTEILAEQHYINIHKLVENIGLKIGLLTSSVKDKRLDDISSGNVDIVIGTHALIQESVSFSKLGIIVIDEQHRFGVMHRAALKRKSANPDTLIMTATPIPRTLALTLYGDLDYSIIDELPPNRSPIKTKHFSEKHKSQIYKLIEDETKKGRQVYVVYPLIEESEKTDLRSAIKGAEGLIKMFPGLRVGLIHGRMKSVEREEVMREFKEGGINILVSTTVIEVGVDVPNATLMVIIHAERFGLAQLHQLRGRVGRGSEQSYCALLSYGFSEDSKRRLAVMVKTTDGFKIAEEDLNIRGPGEFFGMRQSGMPDLKVANLIRDVKILEAARKEAFGLIQSDPSLAAYPDLRASVEDFWGKRLEIFKTG